MADLNRELEEMAELTRRVNEELRQYGQLTAETADALKDAEMKQKYGIENYTKVTRTAADSVAALGRGAMAAGKAMYDGEKGAAAFNTSLDGLTDAAKLATVALTLLMPGGPIIKGVTFALGLLATTALEAGKRYTQAANEMGDALFKGYQGLARTGAAASDGMTGLFENAKDLGLSMKELDSLIQLINDNSRDLVLFRGNVFEGRREFVAIGKEMQKYRDGLMAMGLDQQAIADGLAGYMRLQSRMGLSQNKTVNELAEGARKYLIEMDALSKITGQTRKEMEDAADRALQQQQFAAKVRQLEMSGQGEHAKLLMKLNAIYAAAGPKTEAAFQASVTGNLANADAIELNIASQMEMMRTADLVAKGLMTPVEAAQITMKAIGRFNDQVNTNLAAVNASIGPYVEMNKMRIMSDGDLVKNVEKTRAEQDKQGIKGKTAADQLVAQQIVLRDTQIRANETLERFVAAGIGPATDAMIKLAQATAAGAGAIETAFGTGPKTAKTSTEASKPSNVIGGMPPEQRQAAVVAAKQETKTAQARLRSAEEQAVKYAELARLAEKDASLSREEKEKIKKQAADSERALIEAGNALRQARNLERRQQRIQQAEMAKSGGGGAAATAAVGGGSPVTVSAPSAPVAAAAGAGAGAAMPAPKPPSYDQEGKLGGGGAVEEKQEKTPSGRPRKQTDGAIVHHTGGGSLTGAMQALKDRGLGYHYLIDRDGRVVPFVPDHLVAAHAGKTDKNPKFSNSNTIGISAVAPSDSKVTQEQIRAAIELNQLLARKFGYSTQNVFGHGEVTGRKAADEGRTIVDAIRNGIQPMANGGIIRARPGGTLVQAAEAGVNEAFIPLKDGTVPVTLKTNILGNLTQDLESTMKQLQDQASQTLQSDLKTALESIGNRIDQSNRQLTERMNFERVVESVNSLSSKFDDVVRVNREAVDVQRKILHTNL